MCAAKLGDQVLEIILSHVADRLRGWLRQSFCTILTIPTALALLCRRILRIIDRIGPSCLYVCRDTHLDKRGKLVGTLRGRSLLGNVQSLYISYISQDHGTSISDCCSRLAWAQSLRPQSIEI